MIRAGLRFSRSDAKLLEELAERVRLAEMGAEPVQVFAGAADAARTGEPFIVWCEHPDELKMMADGYIKWGVRRPAIDPFA